jgi:ferritin-like metal-binding protein YciE
MVANSKDQLVKHLEDAHAMEEQSSALLEKARTIAGDNEIASIYSAHHLQTKEHLRYVAERLEAHGTSPSKLKDTAMKGAALGLGLVAQAAPDTPARLAITAFAAENFEVASYRLLRKLAERVDDDATVSVVDRILEQEEAAVELVAGTFDRALEVTLGEPPTSPLIPVTPIGKPSERSAEAERLATWEAETGDEARR